MTFIVRRHEALMGDTGPYCLTLPAAWKDALGTVPMVERVDAELADRRVVSGELRQSMTSRRPPVRSSSSTWPRRRAGDIYRPSGT